MNNLSSYCGLADAKMRASDKDLPVRVKAELESLEYYVKAHSQARLMCRYINVLLMWKWNRLIRR